MEIWIRIEDSLDKKMEEYKPVKEDAMVFAERVHDAQRLATTALKEQTQNRDAGGRGAGGATYKEGVVTVEMKWIERRFKHPMINRTLANCSVPKK